MQIRLAEQEDAEELWQLCEEFIEDQKQYGGPDNRKLLAIGIKWGMQHEEAVVVAEDAGRLVGFCAWVRFPDAADGEVNGLGTYVVPSARNLRVGNRMRAFATEHCREKGYTFVTGAVWSGNVGGMASAWSSGAHVVGTIVEWRL